MRRNEVGALAQNSANARPIIATEKRQQRNSLMLRDVGYRIYAKMEYIPPHKRAGVSSRESGGDENPGKYQAMFERRASKRSVLYNALSWHEGVHGLFQSSSRWGRRVAMICCRNRVIWE